MYWLARPNVQEVIFQICCAKMKMIATDIEKLFKKKMSSHQTTRKQAKRANITTLEINW